MPPPSQRILFEKIIALIGHGWYEMPDTYRGTGAPGIFLEDQLGLTRGPKPEDWPDASGWELKWWTARTQYLTLFHKSPDNSPNIMRYMVRKYGKRDAQGRMSFRHTIRPTSRAPGQKFLPAYDAGWLSVRPKGGNGLIPRWSEQALLGAAGSKLRRLIMVKGERKGQQVRFFQADAYREFSITDFIAEVLRGVIVIDFDCREARPGSTGLRDHGTKFRVAPEHVCRLYMDKQRLR